MDADIKSTEEKLEKAMEEGDVAMIPYLQTKEIKLRDKENKLRDKENKLRDQKKPGEKQPSRQSTRDGEYRIPDILALPKGLLVWHHQH